MQANGEGSVPRWAYPVVLVPIGMAVLAILASELGVSPSVGWDVAWTLSAFSALVGMLLARDRAREANLVRWNRWAAAAACWLLGQLAWDVFGITGFPASPNIADVLWWAFALLVILSMVAGPRGTGPTWVVEMIETVTLIAAAIALCFAALGPIADASSLPLAPKLSALVYPALYVSATVLTVQALIGGSLRRVHTASVRLVIGGIAAQSVGFILWSIQLLRRDYAPGHTLLDPLWVCGLAAMAIGGLLAAQTPEEVAVVSEPDYRGGILPAGLFLALLAALIDARVQHAGTRLTLTLEAGLMFCGGALIARSTLQGRRMRAMLARERSALAALAERETELGRLNSQLIEDSRRDPLTGIGNRRALTDDLPMLETLQREQGMSFAFALCDIDLFKPYNDRLGHLAGDQALRTVAATVRAALRAGDTAYRFGGEELLLVLRDASTNDGAVVAERVRAAVERAGVPHPDAEKGVITVSVGVAGGENDPQTLLARADAALYEAKRLGRNRVVAVAQDQSLPDGGRQRAVSSEEPVPRHLRSMLAVSRAAADAQGETAVLEAVAAVIHTEMTFQVVAVNVTEADTNVLRVVIVQGDESARDTLLGTASSRQEWEALLAAGENIAGAIWLQAGSYEWTSDAAVWTPPAHEIHAGPDAWDREDMLLLPMRHSDGELLGVISVDQPLLGRRPSEEELSVMMAVVDHAALAVEQARRQDAAAVGRAKELRLAAVMLLAETLDLRDPSTARHARTVGEYARTIALQLGLSASRVERIHAAGVLHDLGKLGISDAILHKPGPLDARERHEVKRHPVIGAQILELAGMFDIAGWVRAHHERIDGKGYPGSLTAPEISIEARILAVADAYEAMTADRPYRSGMPEIQARQELMRCTGTQFDPVVVEAFLRSLDVEQAVPEPAALESAA